MGSTQYELADHGTRLVSAIIDGVILGAIQGILSGAFGAGAGAGINTLVGVIYFWYFWTRSNGQTPGKQVMKLRVIKADGTPMTDADAIVRYVGVIISAAVILLGLFWILIDAEHQGWHDKLAKTYVVKV
jgi:uncharacterized RDD family membrane protein YckC